MEKLLQVIARFGLDPCHGTAAEFTNHKPQTASLEDPARINSARGSSVE